MAYAIISVGGKQYRVQEGEKLVVDRLKTEEGKTLNPLVLLFGDEKKTELSPMSVTVTARVVGHVKGEKIRIGKYRKRTGYKRHTGFRASLTELQIEKIGARGAAAPKTEAPAKSAAAATPAPGKAAPAAKPAPAKAAATAKGERVAGMPKDYEELTVAGVAESAPGWRRPMLEAALQFERANAARKGAISALESALAAREEH
ncbi:MAG: 50S ribosomal protein L21 [Actinobacteria bacterium]|nr:50S ribosomal protein L21 [Actinomycetota bacterium]